MRLSRETTTLLVIDVQQKLMPVIHDHERIAQNIERLIRGTHVLGVPALVTEQYVKGLGPTIEPLRRALEETHGYRAVEKMCFSAAAPLAPLERRQVVLAGVETHVCVYQTAMELLEAGHEVTLVADAVSSRTPENRALALRRLESEGVKLSSTEMALFELCSVSGTDEFRAISKLIR